MSVAFKRTGRTAKSKMGVSKKCSGHADIVRTEKKDIVKDGNVLSI